MTDADSAQFGRRKAMLLLFIGSLLLVVICFFEFQRRVRWVNRGAGWGVRKRTEAGDMEKRSNPLDAALACLRLTTPNLNLTYPDDAEEHYMEIRRALAPWSQNENHRYHKAAGYAGPWIENYWIMHFEPLVNATTGGGRQNDTKNSSQPRLSDHFGPYVPLFVPWVDLWVNNGYHYPGGLLDALKSVLRPDVPYVTVSQNDEGLAGKREINMSTIPNVLVLSAGGYGHVPIPMLKQQEQLNNQIDLADRKYGLSYVGSLGHAPKGARRQMHMLLNNNTKLKYKYYYGANWRSVMADSLFSFAPRGFGRTAYHLVETWHMGLIPIHVYTDTPWVPYADLYPEIGYLAHYDSDDSDGIEALVARLANTTLAEIAERERRIVDLRGSHFSVPGIMNQVQLFLLNRPRRGSDLRCRKLPDSIRDG